MHSRPIKTALFVLMLGVGLGIVAAFAILHSRPRYNVVFIVVDTLRADHMSLYGYPRKTTPNIDEFAKDAFVFTNATAPATWTYSSFSSFLSSRYPRSIFSYSADLVNAVRKLEPMETAPQSIIRIPAYQSIIREHLPSIVDILGSFGYATGAFFRLPPLLFAPIDGGFTKYDGSTALPEEPDTGTYAYKDGELNGNIFRWLDKQRGPFFLLVDYEGPHCPRTLGARYDIFSTTQDVITRTTGKNLVGGCSTPSVTLSAEEIESVKNAYDGKVLAADDRIGELLDKLRALHLDKNTIVIITGDHGEELYDHMPYLYHSDSLYQSVAHVPLVIKIPSAKISAKAVTERVSLVDLPPTVLAALGIPVPKQFVGKSLVPLTRGKAGIDETVFLEAGPGWDLTYAGFAILAGDYKFISYLGEQTKKDELYDLVADPEESKDLISQEPKKARELKAKLLRHLLDAAEGSYIAPPTDETGLPQNMDREDVLRSLKNFGYMN